MAKITIEQQIRSAFIKAAKVFIEELEAQNKSSASTRRKQKYLNRKIHKDIRQYSLSGEYIRSFDSVKEASKYLKIDPTCIGYCLRGDRITAGGFQWRKHDDNRPVKSVEYQYQKPYEDIRQYSLSGEYIRSFANVKEASKYSKAHPRCIQDCLRGNQSTAGGFQWRKQDDNRPVKSVVLFNSILISQYSKNGLFIAKHTSIKGAARKVGVSEKPIRDCLKGIQKSAGGYKWAYAETPKKNN